ncbi:response regulator [Nitrospira sp. Nam74]
MSDTSNRAAHHRGTTSASGAEKEYEELSPQQKAELVLCLFRGDSLETVAKDNHVPVHQLGTWKQTFLEHGVRGLQQLDAPDSSSLQTARSQIYDAMLQLDSALSVLNVFMAPASDKRPATCKETILVVDDDDAMRTVMRAILKQEGYCVLDARLSSEALLISGRYKGPIDLLIADVMMPGVTGPEFAQKREALLGKMKILYISGNPIEVVQEKLQKAPGAFLQKPFPPDTFLETVRRILDSKA